MKCVTALSTLRDSSAALRQVVDRAAQGLGGEPASLVLVFASMHHADALGELAALVQGRGLGERVLGCTGESIVGEDREVERGPALSLWALRLPGITARPRQLTFTNG